VHLRTPDMGTLREKSPVSWPGFEPGRPIIINKEYNEEVK